MNRLTIVSCLLLLLLLLKLPVFYLIHSFNFGRIKGVDPLRILPEPRGRQYTSLKL